MIASRSSQPSRPVDLGRRTGLIAIKEGMTSEFDESGERVPLTVLRLDGCQVVAHRVAEINGYDALQLGIGKAKVKNVSKAERTRFAMVGIEPKRHLREFRVSADAFVPIGATFAADHFMPGQHVDVRGDSTGKGFAGGIKRHNFGGLRASHGVSISHRSIGSTGGRQDPGRTFKNKGMPGQLGRETTTVQNLLVHRVDVERGLILLKGAVPGTVGNWVEVRDAVKRTSPPGLPYPGRFKVAEIAPSSGSKSDRHATPEREKWLDPDDTEFALVDALERLADESAAERETAIRVLLREGLAQLERPKTDRNLGKRFRAVMPSLYEALFDRSERVKKRAALAICALRDPSAYASDVDGGDVPSSLEPKILKDLQRYLVDNGTALFSHVDLVQAEKAAHSRASFKFRAAVDDALPMTLAGERPRVPKPPWLSAHPRLEARAHSSDHGATSTIVGAAEDIDGFAAVSFAVDVLADPEIELFVDLVLDGRLLDRHMIPLVDLLPALNR